MVQIIPAVLRKTEEQYVDDMNRLSSCEGLKDGWVHIDLADNKFVQNETIGPETVKKFPTNFRKEAHLMVSHPKDWIGKLVEADFDRIIFHIESADDTEEVIGYIKSKGLSAGLAIKMDTPIEKLQPFVDKIEVILVMSIIPGFQGQQFIPASLEKIKQIKSKGWPIQIGVDGAVRDQNVKQLVEAGVENLTVGSFLLKGNIEENLEKLWETIHGQ
ncbi:hypothetical protein A3B45_04225 [Candidatus Daviesbacteria bacterium RIFCSPLOWO2_01_FULL_39_12]|uniref:Ribulose-phosphate 3-epimerase n=1 Tax=Candidatus Daviesbacteria bacterium RIFCSPLOWO2_01_FULL_39_12 TaxID=1797785 RepID=A0A1F5KNK9_9BACT|nr:MAG: hypothetical protein A3B45_04225 [Candidatus Daviesbacteria bacterium RIFCSPLOWO2_01_FULL_39_12]